METIETRARWVYQAHWRKAWGYSVAPMELDNKAVNCAMAYGASEAEARGILAGIHDDHKHGMLCPLMAAVMVGEV